MRRYFIISLFALIVTLNLAVLPPGQAQSGGVEWSVPIRLSEDTASVPHPAVVADPWGGVHVFWAQSINGDQETANLIFYRYSDGQHWSESNDIFAGPEWMNYDLPYAECTVSGMIHLIWAGSDGLYYSSAPAREASDVRAWKPPQLLVEASLVDKSRLIVDDENTIHIVFALREAGTNVMYLHSQDDGVTWSEPAVVSELRSVEPQVPDAARLALDSHGSLHLVWSENYPPEYLGRRVLYARSTNGGRTWTRPMDLSGSPSIEDWEGNIDVGVDRDDHLHAIWACGTPPGRCYRLSEDGGTSWSDMRRLFGELIGLGAWDAMAADTYGNIYWLGILREPGALYFSRFEDSRWIDPPLPVINAQHPSHLSRAHFPQLAIGQGNQLHIVALQGDEGPVWYLNGRSSWPSMPPPTSLPPTLLPEPASTDDSTPAHEPTPEKLAQTAQLASPPQGPSSPGSSSAIGLETVVWAVVPVALLLTFTLAVSRIRSRR